MKPITFIDLFAGIWWFRLGLEKAWAKCIFSCEIDEHASTMYEANFGDNPRCDITKINPYEIPDFDILCAGFPCQAFSICGKQRGFRDETRWTLFFDICRILEVKKPKAFILENVQNLEKHDKWNTLFIMIKVLNELGYSIKYKILNAKDFWVPQNRERIIIIWNKEGKIFDFDKVKTNPVSSMYNFLDKEGPFEYLDEDNYILLKDNQLKIQKSGLIFCGYRNKKIRTSGVRDWTEHLSRVHKQPNRIYSAKGIHPTIASQEQSGRYFIYVNNKVRKLTLNECYKFMWFPDDFIKIGRNTKLYERIGNSICVPMVEAVAKELIKQFRFYSANIDKKMDVNVFLESFYQECLWVNNLEDLDLNDEQKQYVQAIVDWEETSKGVYTVLVTSLVYKILNKAQDVRRHQANMENGYSGRTFDTKYITPFLKEKQFLAAMKESGWLTRSLEQNIPYNLDFPGKINNKKVKTAFLRILDDIEEKEVSPEQYLKAIWILSIKAKEQKSIQIVNPIVKESKLTINEIIDILQKHFSYSYKSRWASILPVVALYSIYECIIYELKRFNGKVLKPMASHYSCDKSSGNTWDIVVLNADKTLYEVVEVKFDIEPDYTMVKDAYNKFSNTSIQRYYILSTLPPKTDDLEKIYNLIDKIREEHWCQVIVNGVIPTIKYYLRLLENTDIFIWRYIKNLENNSEINAEHKLAWNKIVD